jgi:hypothetical protein
MHVRGPGGMAHWDSRPFSFEKYIQLKLAMWFRYVGVRLCGNAARYFEKKARGW